MLLIALANKSYTQAPKGPDGKALYKKGDCEVVSVKFSECTFCEDSALTKNCKKYWCSEGQCEEAPLTPQIPPDAKGQELPILKESDTTSIIPKSIYIRQGRICPSKGYKMTVSEDRGRVSIARIKGGGGLGVEVWCVCQMFDPCSVIIINGGIECGHCSPASEAKCTMYIREAKQTGWKRLILSTTTK
jgi:hypothetical protein